MALRPRSSPRRSPVAGDGRFSLCRTRLARIDVHPRRRPAPRYGIIVTGATLAATILAALAVWPLDAFVLPGADFAGANPQRQLVARYTIEDFVTRAR